MRAEGTLTFAPNTRTPRAFRRAHGTILVGTMLLALGCRERPLEHRSNAALPAASAGEKAPLLELPPGQAFAWVDAKRYRLRVLDVWPCHEPRAREGASPGGPEPARAEPRPYRLGVAVEVEALEASKASPVLATPAGAELVKDGKVFRAVMKPAPTPSCDGFLEPTRLGLREIARGTLVFEAPDASYFRSATLRFEPPRWGHESRVSVTLPDCFGSACPSLESKADPKPGDAPKAGIEG